METHILEGAGRGGLQAQEDLLGMGGSSASLFTAVERRQRHMIEEFPPVHARQGREEVPFCLVIFLREIGIKVFSRESLRKRTF